MRTRVPIFLVVLAVVLSAGASAQNAPEHPIEQSRVSISVFVTDAHGNPVSAISDGDLSIEDEHKPPRTVIAVTHDRSPLRLGLLVDNSNSQRGSDLYKAGVQALDPFLKQVLQRDADKVFIETFATHPNRPTEWMGADELEKARVNLQPSGGTSLFDAIDLVCKERLTDNPSPARRVLVVLTDGDDNMSRINVDAAITAAQRAKVAIIAISTHEVNIYQPPGDRVLTAHSVLKRLAQNTGGYVFLDLRPKDVQKVFSDIAHKLDSMFQVIYIPVETAKTGEAHQFQIKPVSGKELHVQAPKQYYAVTP
jgi:VWFA-related protein